MSADKEFEMKVQACAEYLGCSGDGGKGPGVLVGGEEFPEFLGNALAYVRVSGAGQEIDGTSLETQAEELKKYAADIRYALPDEQIISDTIPGNTTVRPGLNEVMRLLETGKYHLLLVYTPDRLAREPSLLLNLLDQVAAMGVAVDFLHGPSEDTPESRLVMYITGYSAQRERMLIAERTMRGKRATARMGRMPIGVGGGGKLGYDYDPVTKVRTVNEAEAVVVRMMFEWFAGGRTEHGIAKELNELGVPTKRGGKWHPLTVRNVLKHKSYIGLDYYGMYRCRIVLENKGTPQEKKRVVRTLRPESEWIEIRGFSPRIMTDELWEAVQRRLAMPRARRGRVRMYLVTGYTRCGKCGTPVNGASNYGDKRRYRCRGTQATSTRGKICDAPYIPADELEEAVWGGIVGALTNPAVLLSEMEQYLETGEGDIAGKISELKKESGTCGRKNRGGCRYLARRKLTRIC